MANQVAARLKGDDYQHLTTWMHVLELMRPRLSVQSVTIEDETAASADDVTVRHEPGSGKRDRFYQIKFHTDQREGYRTEILTNSKGMGTSLLQKLFVTWRKLLLNRGRESFEIHFVSNWSWDPSDAVGACFDGVSNRVTAKFFDAGPMSDVGKLRAEWRNHLGATEEDFEAFVRTLHFDLGSTCFDERVERVRDQMEERGLKHDDVAMLVSVGIVRNWIKAGRQVVTREVLDTAIGAHDLIAPYKGDRCVTVLLTTVKKQRIDIQPDYILDWRDRFEGPSFEKGHAPREGVDWNVDLVPELREVEGRVAEETGCRLVRGRGLARLSAWFAFGRVFSESARYVIEVDQQGKLWRSDSKPTDEFKLVAANVEGENFSGEAGVVAVGISVTSSLDQAVRDYLSHAASACKLLLLEPNRPLGHECLTSAGDAVALARQAKESVKALSTRHHAKKVLLFYLGPLSGACFIGHVGNALGSEVQVMEFQNPGYSASVIL